MLGCRRPVTGNPEPLWVLRAPCWTAPREARSLTHRKPPRGPDAGSEAGLCMLLEPRLPPVPAQATPGAPSLRAAPLGRFGAGIRHSESGGGSSSGDLGGPGPAFQALHARSGRSAAWNQHRTLLLTAWVVAAHGPHDPRQHVRAPAHVCGVPGGPRARDARGIRVPAGRPAS